MTVSTSTYLQNLILNATLLHQSLNLFPLPAYVALYRSNPTAADVETSELSGSGYKRVAYPVNSTSVIAGSAWNYSTVVFPTSTSGSWGTFSYIGIRSGSEAGAHSGSLLFFGQLSPAPTVDEGETFIISSGSLKVSLGGAYRQYASTSILSSLLYTTNTVTVISGEKYIGLFHEDWDENPSGSSVGDEIDASGYSRVLAGEWSTPASGSCHNLSDILFTIAAPSDWGEIKAIGIADSLTGNTFYYVDALNSPITVNGGDSLTIKSGCIVVQVT